MAILNIYSVGHFIQWTLIGRYVFKNWYAFFILSIGWEFLELILPYEFAIETYGNKISDVIVNCLGFYLGTKSSTNESIDSE